MPPLGVRLPPRTGSYRKSGLNKRDASSTAASGPRPAKDTGPPRPSRPLDQIEALLPPFPTTGLGLRIGCVRRSRSH